MKVTIAPGDGIGPEIMDVVLDVFRAAEVPLEYEPVALGREAVEAGEPSGIGPEARESVERTGVLLKGPVDPAAAEDVDARARRLWGAFAHKRVYRMLPGVPTPIGLRPLGLTMVRENVGESYETVERLLNHDVAQCHRFTTRPGSLRLHRYTFEMAARKGAKRVTCAHRANHLKLTDGMFLETFYEVAAEYPDLHADDVTVDRLARQLVVEPERFDVLVLPDTQGDILADLAAGLVGGLAYTPSANIGNEVSIFEPVHGPAADAVGLDRANPTALLLSGTMMLRHLGLVEHAHRIESALDRALYQMNRRPDVRHFVPTFHTSVFRHLILGELRRQRDGGPGRPGTSAPGAARRAGRTSSAGRGGGLTPPSLAAQLEGLA